MSFISSNVILIWYSPTDNRIKPGEKEIGCLIAHGASPELSFSIKLVYDGTILNVFIKN